VTMFRTMPARGIPGGLYVGHVKVEGGAASSCIGACPDRSARHLPSPPPARAQAKGRGACPD
jgi:hypothetical protein